VALCRDWLPAGSTAVTVTVCVAAAVAAGNLDLVAGRRAQAADACAVQGRLHGRGAVDVHHQRGGLVEVRPPRSVYSGHHQGADAALRSSATAA
jgi:hypothetical protein